MSVPWTNPHGWALPETDLLLDLSPYAPLHDPAESIAERLVMLGHLTFNTRIWGSGSGRLARYWEAYGERINGATNQPDLASWWGTLMSEISGLPLRHLGLLHEKNLLCRPATLPATSVEDTDVLMVLRAHTIDLRDRTRVWAKFRRDDRTATSTEEQWEDIA